jgi:Icc-related predicted phosphoesterase
MALLDLLRNRSAPHRPAGARTLFFATDFHGSEICFRKFLNAAGVYGADLLIMGGDLSGKLVIPVVNKGAGSYEASRHGETRLIDAADLPDFEKEIRNQGFYPWHLEADELEHYRTHPDEVERLFEQAIVDTVQRWIDLTEDKFRGSDMQIVFAPGNDDPEVVDRSIAERRSEHFRLVEGTIIEVAPGHEMLSTGYTNITPWGTPREYPEEVIRDRIERIAQGLTRPETAIFNLHVPPYASQLDTAPLVNVDLSVQTSMGQRMTGPAGSTAVREALEKWQPLLSLHGHIHESGGTARIGRTLAINPGSEYSEGVLRGALVTIGDGKLLSHQLTTG